MDKEQGAQDCRLLYQKILGGFPLALGLVPIVSYVLSEPASQRRKVQYWIGSQESSFNIPRYFRVGTHFFESNFNLRSAMYAALR